LKNLRRIFSDKPARSSSRLLEQRYPWLYVLARHPQARAGMAIVLFLILMGLFAPVLAPGDPSEYTGEMNAPPSKEHILGTDPLGRDELALTVWGARETLLVGFSAAAIAMVIATIVGVTAGYFRGWIDDLLMLITNQFLIIPGLVLLIVIAAYLSPGRGTVILALAFTGWAFHARILRAMTLSLREKDYVAASVVAGESSLSIIFRQILPNMMNLIVGGFIGTTIFGIGTSTALSYLGLTSLTDVSWGTNLFYAQNGNVLLLGAWWAFVPPGLCVALAALGLTWINFGMDEITNPRLRAERQLKKALGRKGVRHVRVTPVRERES